MAATKQSQAVSQANAVLSAMQSFAILRAQVNEIVTQYTDQGVSTVWAALPTTAVGTDGSLGTADGSPNVAHAIDTRVVTGLARAVSSNDLTTAVSLLQAFQAFLTGATVATANRNQVIDPLVGG